MSAWSKIDELRRSVADRPLIEIEVGPIKTVKDAEAALKDIDLKPDRLVVMGWEILLSRRKQEGVVLWHFSAKLYPHGRSSTEHDWKVLGQIAARVKAPRDPVLTPEDPNAVIHWSWTK